MMQNKVFMSILQLFIGLVDASYMGPCQHGMVRPQVTDGTTASDTEVKCEYIE
jgi:hypothetical protein